MSPEERESMEAAGAAVFESFHLRRSTDLIFDALTAAGFSISLASVRDHTNCRCGGTELVAPERGQGVGSNFPLIPCPGGSPVVWSTETEDR